MICLQCQHDAPNKLELVRHIRSEHGVGFIDAKRLADHWHGDVLAEKQGIAVSVLEENARLKAENSRLREALEAAPPIRVVGINVLAEYMKWHDGPRAEALKGHLK